MTAVLDPRLEYVGDSSGVVPQVRTNEITWAIGPVAYPVPRTFALNLAAPSGPADGRGYAVQWRIRQSNPDASPANDAATTRMVVEISRTGASPAAPTAILSGTSVVGVLEQRSALAGDLFDSARRWDWRGQQVDRQ